MNSFNFKYIIILIGLSSLGVILFQVNWLNESYNITEKNFSESAFQSLKNVKNAIENYRASKNISIEDDSKTAYNYESKDSLFLFKFYSLSPSDSISKKYDAQFYNTMNAYRDEFLKRKNKESALKEFVFIIHGKRDTLSLNDYKEVNIDSILSNSLSKSNIELKHSFGFKNRENKKWNYIGGEILKDTVSLEKSKYILDTIEEEDLHLVFYDKKQFLYKTLFLNIIISSLLVLIILFSFWYALRIILKQKHLSQIKTDFINNITHEFKTPLASISMAAATIEEPEIIKNENVVRQFTKVIKEENSRMNKQVEMILKMAQNDNLISKLDKSEIDVNAIIKTIVVNNSIRVEKKGGKINYQYKTKNTVIIADEMHIYQAINNLVDNAIKYSYNNVDVLISSKKEDDYLVIDITDKGIGVKKEDENRIFDKFYRVSTRNLHNVKGFGLGLNYVKQTAEAHGGYIALKRNKIGTTFSLHLPINND